MAAPDLVIGIGAEYVGAPAFSKANRSVSTLQKSVNGLAKTFVGVFAAQKLLQFGKASVQAFNADNQSAKRLTGTLDSLGLAFEDSRVKTLIANMEKTYKVADDNLRPAMQSLLQVTGSVSKSQSILETALNASAGSGTDLATTTQDLAQAYVGNLKGLRKYNLGLTQAELKTKSFAQIQDLLNKKFQGQAMIKAADPLNALALAADNAKETIGKGLVDAINSAVGAGTGINDITANVNALATATAGLIRGLGNVAGFISYGFKGLADSAKATKELFTGPQAPQIAKGQYPKGGGKAIDTAAAARKKADQEALARAKQIAAATQAQAKSQAEVLKSKQAQAILDKASAVLAYVSPVFDIQGIEIYAALQKTTNEGDRARLQLMQDIGSLQRALAANDTTLAAQIASNVQQDVKLLSVVQGGLNNLKSPDNPLKSLLDDIAAAIAALDQLTKKFQLSPAAAFAAKVAVVPTYEQYASPWQFGGASADVVTGTINPMNNQVTINVAGTVITEQQLSNSLANLNASGIPSNINRVNVNYGTP